jgi:hypothetical protein
MQDAVLFQPQDGGMPYSRDTTAIFEIIGETLR